MRKATLPWVLLVANAAACALFLLREPAPQEYLAEVDAARRNGGMYLVSGIDGTLACRQIYSWSEWHGGETLGVKVLEVANLPALVVTGVVAFVGELGVARVLTACTWSWLLAAVFIAAASLQWWIVGVLIAALARRVPGGSQNRRAA
jgi:hypothetical protein